MGGAFDRCRVDVFAAGDDQVFDAVLNIDVAILIHNPGIARVQPAIGINRLGGRFRMKAPAEHLKPKGRDISAVADRAIENGADHAFGNASIRE